MTIIQLISDISSIGGGQTLVSSLTMHARKSDKDKVVIISLYEQRDTVITNKLLKNGIEIYFLSKKPGIDFKCCKELGKLIKKIQPDIIHAHLSTYITLFFVHVPKKIKVFYTFHSIVNKQNSGSILRIDNLIIKFLITIKKIHPVAISKIVKTSIEKFYNVKNIPIVENGVDLQVFNPNCNFFERIFDIVVVGSFTQIKNQLEIIKILHAIQKDNIIFRTIFLGDGPLLKECENYVKKHDIKGIYFQGNVSNVHEYLQKSYFLLLKSKFEGNPMVINEAIACGTIVISNKVGGIPDIVNENNGLLFEDNADVFTKNLRDALLNKNNLLKIIHKNLEFNRQNVSIEKTYNSYIELFNK